MSDRIYTVSFTAVAVAAAQDFFELTAADDKPVEIIGLFLGQYSDFGDAAAEGVSYSVVRGNTTGGSGGTAPTPRPVRFTDGAAGFTAEVNNTTTASAGTAVTLHSDTFNIQAGEKLWVPEGCGWVTGGADLLCVRLNVAPTDSLTMNGTIYVREA